MYNKGKHYEQLKKQQELQAKEQELKYEQMKLEVDRKLLEQDQKIAAQDSKINKIELEQQSLRAFVENEFNKVYTVIEKEISQVKTSIKELKLWVGQEIHRVDRNVDSVVNSLQQYAVQVEQYRKQSEQMVREANQSKREAEFILNRANHHYEKVQWQEQKLRQELENYNGKMLVEFQKQKLMLDEITLKQYHAAQNVAYEKMGVHVMEKELMGRVAREKQSIEHTKNEVLQLEKNIQLQNRLSEQRVGSERKLMAMQDRLAIANEQLTHQRNRMDILNGQMVITQRMIALQESENRQRRK